MWVAKIRFNGSLALISAVAKKNNLDMAGYPISHFKTKNHIIVYFIGMIRGNEKSKSNFLKELKDSERVNELEEKNNFITGEILDPLENEEMYNSKIIHIEPVRMKEGNEVWTVGAWKKKDLTKFLELIENKYNGNIISILHKKITNVSMVGINPELTFKQKQAMEIAIEKGYYSYPRKIGLQELAKLSNCSYSTYQSHLRKAEMKMIPYSFNR